MSVMSKLGKILSIAGPLAAIPFTGGTSVMALGGASGAMGILGKAGKIASAVAPVLGGAAGARGQAQQVNAQQQIPRDEINQRAAIENNALPGRRLGTAARASYAKAGPVKFGGLPTPGFGSRGEAPKFTGGFNEELDPRVKQLSDSVMDQELQSQLTGGDKVPGATPELKSGMIDKLLGGGATAASMLGAVDSTGMLNRTRPVNNTPTPNGVGPSNPLDWQEYLRQRPGVGILQSAQNLYRPDLLKNVAF